MGNANLRESKRIYANLLGIIFSPRETRMGLVLSWTRMNAGFLRDVVRGISVGLGSVIVKGDD